MQVHINAPAHCWSRRGDRPNGCSECKYTGYTTRSEKTRNAERTSQGNVASKRYKSINQSGHLETIGQGWTTGHQKRRPVVRNEACSMPCHVPDRRLSMKTAG